MSSFWLNSLLTSHSHNFYDIVALAFEILDLLHGGMVEFLHGFTIDQVHGIAGITSWTSVQKQPWTSNARGMSFLVVAIQQIRTDTFLPTVTCVLDVNLVLFGGVRQPLMCKQRLFVLWRISHGWNDGDRIFRKVIGAIHEMVCRRNGEGPKWSMSVTS